MSNLMNEGFFRVGPWFGSGSDRKTAACLAVSVNGSFLTHELWSLYSMHAEVDE